MDNQSADVSAYHSNSVEHGALDGPALAGTAQASRNTPLSDSRLIAQIGQRDERALGTLYDHYGALIYTIALRITYDRAVAEMVVQDVFQAVWQSASSFQIGASVPMWLVGMARLRAIDATQPLGRRTRTGMATHNEPHAICADKHSAGVADALKVRCVLGALPADQRETVELAYYDGLTCREIATLLRESLSTIKIRLRVGLFKLYEQLSNDAEDVSELST